MDQLFLLVVFVYYLHKWATEKGVSAWPIILNFISGFIFILFAFAFAFVLIFGVVSLDNEADMRKVLYAAPFPIMLEILLFIYFKRKIASMPSDGDGDDEEGESQGQPPKKDLSYFR